MILFLFLNHLTLSLTVFGEGYTPTSIVYTSPLNFCKEWSVSQVK